MKTFRKIFFYILATFFFIFLGGVFFVFKRGYIVFHFPNRSMDFSSIEQKKSQGKEIKFYFYKEEKIRAEKKSFVWFANTSDNIKNLTNSWLDLLSEEKILIKSAVLDSVSLSSDGLIAFLSFNKSFIDSEWSIYYKWQTLESLLKTLRGAGIAVKKVVFLVNHKVMKDDHLDFFQEWPIDGFL